MFKISEFMQQMLSTRPSDGVYNPIFCIVHDKKTWSIGINPRNSGGEFKYHRRIAGKKAAQLIERAITKQKVCSISEWQSPTRGVVHTYWIELQ